MNEDERVGYIMLVVCGMLMLLVIFGIASRIISSNQIKQSIQSEEGWQEKTSYCENQNKKYYKDACWVQGNWDRQDGGYRFPIEINEDGTKYLGQKERVYGGYFPHL